MVPECFRMVKFLEIDGNLLLKCWLHRLFKALASSLEAITLSEIGQLTFESCQIDSLNFIPTPLSQVL